MFGVFFCNIGWKELVVLLQRNRKNYENGTEYIHDGDYLKGEVCDGLEIFW